MNSTIRWFVPKRSTTAHAYLANLGNENVEFWCGTVRGQYDVRCPRKGEARCERCIAYIRHARRGRGKKDGHA